MFCKICGKDVVGVNRCLYCGHLVSDEYVLPDNIDETNQILQTEETYTFDKTVKEEPKETKGLAIAGLVLAFIYPPIGLIMSIISLVKGKSDPEIKKFSIIGIVVGAVVTALIPLLVWLLPNLITLLMI